MSRRLRVLYVDYSLGFGGAIKSLALTLQALPGVEPLIVTAQEPEIVDTWLKGYRVWQFRRMLNYRTTGRIRAMLNRRLPGPLRWPLLTTLAVADVAVAARNACWLAGLLRQHRVDVLHLNNAFTPPEAIRAARIARVPVVVHLRGFQDDRSSATLRSMEHVAHVITVSDAVGEDARRSTPLRAGRMTTIHDPVDLRRVAAATADRGRIRQLHGLESSHVAVGIFGRVIKWKGQIVFVRAAIQAMGQHPDLRAVIVGDESDWGREYFDRIRAEIAASGLEDRFVLAGYTAEVEAYYAAIDVVVHASIEPEPFGMVVPEGMAAGRAVIAADAGGPREVVTHGHDGLLVPPGDVDALAAAMLRLSRDRGERERLAANAYRTAHARFGIETNARAVRAVYDAVLPAATPAGRRMAGAAAEAP